MALTIYRSNQSGWLPPVGSVTGYNSLSITPHWRAVNFLANNLGSLSRSVHADGAPVAHSIDRYLKRKPNDYQNASQFWRAWFFAAIQESNGYARIERGPRNEVVALHNLRTCDVTPYRFRDGDGAVHQFFYVQNLADGPLSDAQGNALPVLPGSDVLHLMGASFEGELGAETSALFADTFLRAKTLDRYATMYLASGTHVKGAIEIPEGAAEEQVEQIVDMVTKYQGPESSGDLMVLFGGAKLNNSTISPVESQLVEQGSVVTKQIAQIHGVHPFYLYDDKDGKYNNNPDAAAIELTKFTLRHWIDQVEDELSVKLLTEAEQEQGYTINLNINGLLRGDTKSVSDIAQNETKSGIRTRNEARALVGLPPDSDPASDQLQTLGATTPTAPAAEGDQTPQDQSQPSDAPTTAIAARNASRSEPDAAFALLRPIIDAACEAVDDRTAKAFASKAGKPEAERVPWGNVFAETQARIVGESLSPIAVVLKAMGAWELPVALIAERYGASIKRRVKSGDAPTLNDIITETLGEK